MSHPPAYADWATNALYAGGPNAGTATKVAPSGGRMADGWRNNDVPPAQEQNYWQSLVNDWIKWLDAGSYEEVDIAGLTAADGVVDGTTVRTLYGGSWTYTTATPYTPTAFWVKTATGMGVGQWINNIVPEHNLGRIVSVGPVPGEAFETATPAGRINKQFIDHGFFTNDADLADGSAHSYTTTSTSLITFSGANVSNLGLLTNGDIIHLVVNATALTTAGAPLNYQAFTEISFDNGGSWLAVTSNGGSLAYRVEADNIQYAVQLGFVMLAAGVTGNTLIRFRGKVFTAGTLTLNVDSWYALVTRA